MLSITPANTVYTAK